MPAPCGRHSELATEGTFFQVFSVKSGVNLLGGGRLLFCPELFMLRSRSFFEASVFVYQFLHKKSILLVQGGGQIFLRKIMQKQAVNAARQDAIEAEYGY
jgi:hypothetical protein